MITYDYLLEKRNPTDDTRNPPTYHCPIPRTERYPKGGGGPVTKYSLRLAALSCSAYQALPNYNSLIVYYKIRHEAKTAYSQNTIQKKNIIRKHIRYYL